MEAKTVIAIVLALITTSVTERRSKVFGGSLFELSPFHIRRYVCKN